MHKTVVLDVVGLTPSLLGPATPNLSAFAARGHVAQLQTILPAVTCSVQATFLTGKPPSEHGIVGNGWYFRDEHEIKFWRQSNALIQQPQIWEMAKALDPSFTGANLFWWYNMYSGANYAVTPRPMYLADGRKLPDVYSQPAELRMTLQADLGTFPLFDYWGPRTSIRSSQWIAAAALRIDERYDPTLTLIYLPHLDYSLQRDGPGNVATDLNAIDAVCGDLIEYYQGRGAHIIILSEYGIVPVQRPVHLNRLFREQGWIKVREEMGHELLDPGASDVFAVADHQVAHVYARTSRHVEAARQLLANTPGVAQVLDADGKREARLDHERAGDLVAVAEPDAWFTYYYWDNDTCAPDFARTVDIHRKPGYDPVELFLDPQVRWPQIKVGWTLLKKALGFRTLLEVISLDASLVRGSHGRSDSPRSESPLCMTNCADLLPSETIDATAICSFILQHLVSR